MSLDDKTISHNAKRSSPYETVRFWVIQYVLLALSGIFGVSVLTYCIKELLKYPNIPLLYILSLLAFLSVVSSLRFFSSLLHYTKLLRRNRFLEYTHEGAMSVSSITEYVKQENKKSQDLDDFLKNINQTTKRSSDVIRQMSIELIDSKNVIQNIHKEVADLTESVRKERERNLQLMEEKERLNRLNTEKEKVSQGGPTKFETGNDESSDNLSQEENISELFKDVENKESNTASQEYEAEDLGMDEPVDYEEASNGDEDEDNQEHMEVQTSDSADDEDESENDEDFDESVVDDTAF